MMRGQQDQQSRMFYELSTLVLNMLRSPPSPISFSDHPHPTVVPPSRPSSTSSSLSLTQISPAGFASLLLGISVALMLCGSVTFFIGFFLMPWVFGLVMVLYVAGIVSTLSTLGRSFLCYATTPRKEIPELRSSVVGFSNPPFVKLE
ncbi:Polyadenylate-binding protein like [Senna tora]|uniref:Polyadenylate-binding protein like n=1 Tax=Senna tora TaxID=362788 RepID=A0A834X6K7_9FABA|nr:Polyadenylate-binding protein like [Senna tora]